VNYLSDGGIFVVQTLCGLIVLALNLRFLMQISRANYYNPIAQGLVKATNPLISPFRAVLPVIGRIDLANLMAAWVCQTLGIVLTMLLATGTPFMPVYLLWSVVAIIASVLNLYFFALLILVIASWLAPYSANPALELVREITEPICAPVRRVIPALGGLDFSIIVIFIGLSLLENNLLVRPLAALLNMPRGLVFGF
jgi:YggT family protein|tara:strand:+ start:159 stop:749 length:591 start_codon:yes stop_codon:yes gene_type:complete